MEFWSEGLGKKELVMGLQKATVASEEEAIILTGVVDAPADWAYRVTMETADWTVVLRTATSPEACVFLSQFVGVRRILLIGWSMVRFIAMLAMYRIGVLVGVTGSDQSRRAVSAATGGAAPSVKAGRDRRGATGGDPRKGTGTEAAMTSF